MIDPARFEAGIAAGIAALLYSAIQAVAIFFAVPPPSGREVGRVLVNMFLITPMSWVLGYGFAVPFAAAATGSLAGLFEGAVQIDPLGAGIIIGMFSVKGLTLVFDVALELAIKKMRRLNE